MIETERLNRLREQVARLERDVEWLKSLNAAKDAEIEALNARLSSVGFVHIGPPDGEAP